jgi:hypothetical protein
VIDLNLYARNNKHNCANMASLKELTTEPPMSAEQHAALMRKRHDLRMMVESARESIEEARKNAW